MPDVANRPVTSREYKLMLNVDRFADRGAGAQTFWAVVEFLAKNGGGTAKAQNEEELRKTWYLDTPGHELAMRGYSLRIRKEESGHKLTLKLRSPDRYLAAAERVEAKGEATAKFEEDILPPFVSKFAHSVSIERSALPDLTTVSELAAFFPSVADLGLRDDTALSVVNGFQAVEVARKVGKIDFGPKPVVKAAMSFWYLRGTAGEYPFGVEFSFDYDLEDPPETPSSLELFPAVVVEGAGRLFASLQRQVSWLDVSGTTKTAAVYADL